MRIFKKRVAILLAALLVLSAFSMVAFADDGQSVVVATQDEATPDQATDDETTPDESQPATEATQPATEATQDEPATEATEPTTDAPVANVWTVAGNIPALGGDWDPANTANALTEGENGIFSISWDNVAAGEYEFKVTNGTWDEAYGLNGENFYVNVTADSDLKITFNAETKEITVSGTNVTTERPVVEVVAGYYVTGSAGLCGTDWANKADPATLMFKGEDGNFYKDFTNVAAGTYNFKVIYVDANGKVTWHPGGMGNDSEVTVETDGSLVRVSFTQVVEDPTIEGADGQEAAVATVYADPSQAPEIKPYVEPTTEPTTQATEATQPATSATQPTTAAPAAKVALNKTSVSLKAGKTATIKVTGTTAKATFKSSKTSVAKVSSKGKVTALKKGTATITVKVAGKTLKCKVKVTTSPKIKVAGKKFSAKKTYTVKKGKTLKVKVTGKAKAIKNKFKVNKKKGLKVSGAKTVKIKAKKKGTYKVTLTVNKSKPFVIKVKVK